MRNTTKEGISGLPGGGDMLLGDYHDAGNGMHELEDDDDD